MKRFIVGLVSFITRFTLIVLAVTAFIALLCEIFGLDVTLKVKINDDQEMEEE